MKKMLLTITEGLYTKIKSYAAEEETTILGAIRLILIKFFKEKK